MYTASLLVDLPFAITLVRPFRIWRLNLTPGISRVAGLFPCDRPGTTVALTACLSSLPHSITVQSATNLE